jgi:predicted ATP-dependent endonuclease of OLD family
MKVRRCIIERFKKFDPPGVELDLQNQALGEVADRYLILGDNASGKTTILQAIGLTLSLAQRKIPDQRRFGWTGWAPDRLLVGGPPNVELEVEFTDDEIAATKEAARRWWELTQQDRGFEEPGESRIVKLRLEGATVRTGERREIYQFRGRSYVAMAQKIDSTIRSLFPRLPGVFWYDQFRNIALSGAREQDEGTEGDSSPQFVTSVQRLDKILKSWHRVREQRGPHPGQDFLGELGRLYGLAFPGHTFAGVEPVYEQGPTPTGDRFVLNDGKHAYGLGEMSGGEQSIFPILFEFVRQQIHRSVVLIDEIDLNLHPPLAQKLLGLLPRLGGENQFLFTTHSRAVSALVSPHAIHRLPEGQPCL